MTLTVDAKAFHAALARAVGAVERSRSYPILNCVRLEADGSELEIVATNLDSRIAIRLPAEGDLAPICIESARLTAVTSQLKDRGQLRLDLEAGDAEPSLRLAAGRSRFSFATLSPTDFPNLSADGFAVETTIAGTVLGAICSALEPAISTEATRLYLNGICLQAGTVADPRTPGHLVAVATDGYKLAARHMAIAGLPASPPEIIVPRGASQRIPKLFGDAETVSLRWNDTRLALSAGDTDYLTKLIEGIFPDWRRVAPKGPATHSYDTQALLSAVNAAAALQSSNAKTGKAVRLEFGEGETTVRARDLSNPGFEGSDTCPHSTLADTKATSISVNADYFVEMVERLGSETVQIAIAGFESPITVRSATVTDRLAIIMPVRG